MPDFIPAPDPGFDNWQDGLLTYVAANRAALGISTGDLAALTAAQTAWAAAYGTHQTSQARAVSDRQSKDDARATYTTLIRAASSSLNLTNLSVTNAGAYRVVVSSTTGGTATSQAANLLFFGDLKLYAATTLAGPVGQQFRVDYADVLGGTTNWFILTNVTLPYSPYLVIDPASPGKTNRFYRAVPLP